MTKGHALLIPKAAGYADIYDMPADVAGEVLKVGLYNLISVHPYLESARFQSTLLINQFLI
jgi:hypothetical protein